MFTRRHEPRRFRLDAPSDPQAPQRAGATPASSGSAPVTVKIRSRRTTRRFRVMTTEPQGRGAHALQAVRTRARLWRRMTLTLAQRRRMQRLGLVTGSVVVVLAVVISALLLIPATHAALFPPSAQAARTLRFEGGSTGALYPPAHLNDLVPFTTLQPHFGTNAGPAPTIQGQAAFVFDPQRGWLLYQQNADTSFPAASLTKVMTLLIAVDSVSLDEEITIGPDAAALVNSDNSYMGVSAGEQLSLRELLYGLIVVGGNDAAIAIADAVAGNEDAFVALMNQRAVQLGLTHTHFVTADGVDDNDVTSAADMAKLAALALTRPGVEQITSTYNYSLPQTPTHKTFNLQGANDLLPGGAAPYPGANGVKTGYTSSAGYCMAFSAQSNGHLLVGVVLGDPSPEARASDAHALLSWGFAQE